MTILPIQPKHVYQITSVYYAQKHSCNPIPYWHRASYDDTELTPSQLWWHRASYDDTEPQILHCWLYIIPPLNPIKLASPSSDTANYSGSYLSYIPQFHYLPIHSHASWCSMLFPVFLHQNQHFHPDFPFRVFERAPSDIFGHPGRVQPGADSRHGNLQGLHHLAGKRKPWVPRAEVAESLEGS